MGAMGMAASAPSDRPEPRVAVSPLVATIDSALAECVDLSRAPADFPLSDLLVIPRFLSASEQSHLFSAASAKIRRIAGRKYEEGHLDKVIFNYRECTISSWGMGLGRDLVAKHPMESEDPVISDILKRVYALFPSSIKWLAPHLLELRESDGEIRAHVDNVRTSGGLVCGICLGSPAVSIFRPVNNPKEFVKVLLEPGTFYAQTGRLRYDYTHEIPGGTEREFKGQPVARDRRISVMFRDELV